jgi:hypothetical protein
MVVERMTGDSPKENDYIMQYAAFCLLIIEHSERSELSARSKRSEFRVLRRANVVIRFNWPMNYLSSRESARTPACTSWKDFNRGNVRA